MLNTAFTPWPNFTQEEADAVSRVLLSNKVNYWTGTECREFEKEFAVFAGTKHAIALTNGTVALDLALHGLKIGSMNGGTSADEVIVTPRTFLASVSCVINAGATPVFADVDVDSGNLTAETMLVVLTQRTRAMIVVHLAGWPCDMDPIMELADIYGIKVIEDCAQAHGARYKGRSVGSIGHIGAWSFCQDKIMTTGGEGGIVTTNDPDLWSRMWAFKDHGKSYDAVYNRHHALGFKWLHESFGTNWRMIEMQAAIGRIQLRRMAVWSAKRSKNAEIIRKALEPFSNKYGPIKLPELLCKNCAANSPPADFICNSDCAHANYKFYAYIRPENLCSGWTRDKIIEEINEQGVPCYQGTCSEVYLEKAFEGSDYQPKVRLTNAKKLGETSIMFLIHPTLSDSEMQKTAIAIKSVFQQAAL